MKEYKNIDELFKEGAGGFQVTPSEGLYEQIETAHFGGKGLGAAFYRWAAAALLLLLTATATWFIFSGDGDPETNVFPTEVVEQQLPTPAPQAPANNAVSDQEQPLAQSGPVADKGDAGASETAAPEQELAVFTQPLDESSVKDDKGLAVSSGEEIHELGEASEMTWLEQHGLIDFFFTDEPEDIDPRTIKGMEAYLKQRSKVHYYTGAGATVGMMYYPTTTDQFTWSADMAVGLIVHNFYFETGVGYQETQERGIYQINFRSQDSVGYYNEVIGFEVNPDNPEDITYKTRQVTVYDSVEHYVHQTPLFKYNYLNIPLKVGYRFYNKKKFSVSAETGIVFSKLLSSEIPDATLNNPDYELIAVTNQTPERVDLNFQWQLSLRLNYRIAKSFSVAVQPAFSKYLNSIYDTEAGYSSVKPYSMGVRFGCYYDF